MRSKKGETGIGTLILLLSFIIIAGIAAMVYIRTSYSLQNKALHTGKRTKDQLSTAPTVLYVYAEDGDNPTYPNTIDKFYVKLKLQPGSERIDLEEVYVGADFEFGSSEMVFNRLNESMRNCTNNGSVSGSDFFTLANGTGNFSSVPLVKGTYYKDGYVSRGDLVLICFQAPYRIPESKDFAMTFVPKLGVPITFESATPDVINQKRVDIYPVRTHG